MYCPNPGSAPLLNGFGCGSCRAGTYASAAVVGPASASLCIDCPMGTFNLYTDSSLVTSCIKCPAGTFSNVTGLSVSSGCQPCGKGSYSAFDASSCIPCAAGSYSDEDRGVFCKHCPPGTASSLSRANSSTVCKACKPGFYSTAEGSAACSPCPAGSYCAESGLTSDGVRCLRGTYSQYAAAISNETCIKCPPGSYCPDEGTISPVPCALDGGSFSSVSGATNSNQCQYMDCPPGYFCPPGASFPTACPAGYFSPINNASSFSACQTCNSSEHRGYYCPGIIK